MYPASFEYHTPASVQEAVALLVRYQDEAKLLAGGHSLLPIMKLRFAQPKHLIDLKRIPGMSGVGEWQDGITIGARTTHRDIESSEIIRRALPVLAEAAALIGDPMVRNRGTIGGSLAHADPSADLPAVMLALEATMKAVGRQGERSIPASEFFVSLLTTALGAEEVLTEVRIPRLPARTGSAYEKYPHPASRYAVVGVAAVVTLDGDGRIAGARIGVTGAAAVASRAMMAEHALNGARADDAALDRAAAMASSGLELREDAQGPAAYKAQLVSVYARRALGRALARARTAS